MPRDLRPLEDESKGTGDNSSEVIGNQRTARQSSKKAATRLEALKRDTEEFHTKRKAFISAFRRLKVTR